MNKSVLSVIVALSTLIAACLVGLRPAEAVQTVQDRVVSSDPASFTPNVLDGSVESIQQIGDMILIGGIFTQVQSKDGVTYARSNLAAFSATTGQVSTSFVPDPDGEVTSIIPSGDGTTVFVGGYFNNISGGGSASLAKISAVTGARVSGFKPPKLDGRIRDLRLSQGRLWIAGKFSTVAGAAQPGLATVNPTTGAPDLYMQLRLAGVHNGGMTSVGKIDIAPDGKHLVAIGNFDTVNGTRYHQVFMLNLAGASAALENWQTNFYTTACSSSFESYMRDLDFSPDGSYFVISTTGAYGGRNVACDSTARFDTDVRGTGLSPRWINNTGGDTTYAVAVTGTAVYTGGHARWQNNPMSADRAGQGAVARPGIAALDPINGLPLSWNPTRDRGVGVFDLLATSTGLWVGSDTDRIGNSEYHAKIAYFPLAGGVAIKRNTTPTLPNDISLAGRRVALVYDDTLSRVAYDGTTRGPLTPTANGSISWQNNRGAFMLNGLLYAGWSDGTFDQRSYDGTTFGPAQLVNTGDLLAPMTDWHTDVKTITGMFFDAGRIYYTLSGQQSLFYRYFTPESNVVGALRFTASPSVTGISFSQVNGMLLAGSTLYFASSTDGSLRRIGWSSPNGAPIVGSAQTLTTGVDWRARSLFLFQDDAGRGPNQLPVPKVAVSCSDLTCSYSSAGSADPDGSIQAYAWNFGDGSQATDANPSHRYPTAGTYSVSLTVTDDRGGQTTKTQSVSVSHVNTLPVASFGQSCQSLTCAFDGSASGDTDGQVASYAWDFGDAVGTGRNPTHTFPASGTYTVKLTVTDNEGGQGTTSHPVTVTRVNSAPSASFTTDCTGLTCSLDGSASADSDGTITDVTWTFGDGDTGSGATTTHTYSAAGSYDITLTVKDNDGATSKTTHSVSVVDPARSVDFVGASKVNANASKFSVQVPSNATSGDTMLLFFSDSDASASITGPAGWTLVDSAGSTNQNGRVWRKAVGAGEAGSTIQLSTSILVKADATLLVYRGAADSPIAASGARSETELRATHTTPTVTTSVVGGRLVSYWGEKSSATTTLSAPGGVTTRSSSSGTGSGRITALAAESNAAVVPGTVGGLTATADSESARALMFTVVLAPRTN